MNLYSKIMSLILAASLSVTLVPQTAFAGIVNEGTLIEANGGAEQTGSYLGGDFQISAGKELQLSSHPAETDESLNEKAVSEDWIDGLDISSAETSIQEELQSVGEAEEELEPSLHYGTVTGYLSATDDYDLYSVPLMEGQYLQLKLTLPTDSIDYDLLLLDSSLSIMKTSTYYSYNNTLNNAGVIPESVGYIADSSETVYACVYSVNGGSSTYAYTLDFTIGENTYDSGEPDENADEATELTFVSLTAGASSSRTLCSPIDNDWYKFTVLNSPQYDKIRFSLTSSSSTNGCSFELYQDIGDGGHAMHLVAAGNSGEVALTSGKYYLRVISTNTFTTYDVGDIPTYSMSLLPVSRVDAIEYLNYTNANEVTYNEGTKYRVDGTIAPSAPKRVGIRGKAVYKDTNGISHPSVNAIITCKVENTSWTAQNRSDLAITQNSAIVASNGIFSMDVYFNYGVGSLRYQNSSTSVHKYDLMNLSIINDNNIIMTDKFYYLVYTIN